MAGAGFPGAGYMPLSMRAGAPGGFAPAYDAFADSIVHVYEPARRVLSSYTGNLVRLRRASDNAETNFGYLGNGNLDTVAIAAWAGGASYVVTVYDQGPFGDNVTMAVAANQPLYVAAIRNGHAGMRFNGTSQYLQGAFTTGGALSQPINLFAVAALNDGGANYHIMIDGDDETNRMACYHFKGPPTEWNIMAGTALPSIPSDANWNIWAVLYNGAVSQFWINGVSRAAGNAGAHNADGITIGARLNNQFWWKGDISSAVVVDPSLSDAGRSAMQVQMNNYWGVF